MGGGVLEYMEAEQWAKAVTADLLRTPPSMAWRGDSVWSVWIAGLAPSAWLDRITKKMTGLDKVGEITRKG